MRILALKGQPIVLPLAVTLGAMASQFSASTADSIGTSGLLHDISVKRIAIRYTYPLIGIVGALIVWEHMLMNPLRWQELSAKLGSWFVGGEIKFFEDSDAALAWLQV